MQAVNHATIDSSVPPQPHKLEYGRRDRVGDASRRLGAEFWERIHGIAYFFGVLLGIVGGPRQAVWAMGLAITLGGLGYCFNNQFSFGPGCMALGGLLIGLAYPLPGTRKKL